MNAPSLQRAMLMAELQAGPVNCTPDNEGLIADLVADGWHIHEVTHPPIIPGMAPVSVWELVGRNYGEVTP